MSNRAELDTRPWSAAVTKILALSEDSGARIVGVTGHREGVGVSSLSREIARAYARHGIKALLVDGTDEGTNAHLDLAELATLDRESVSNIDLAELAPLLHADSRYLRKAFEAVALNSGVVVVDLPPVRSNDMGRTQALGLIGSACRIVFLVCLSGAITKSELTTCFETCKFHRVPVEGILINDWKEPLTWLAPGL
jgi:Mrp family chromosome partitioning ATPase